MPHLVDTTMFWSATGGGVGRYLRAKHAWLAPRPGWRHTLLVPGAADAEARGDAPACIAAPPLPCSGGYRVPWRRGAIAARLQALRPDLIEAGDPYRMAWAALDAGQRLGVPVVAMVHSNLAALARLHGGPLSAAAERAARAYLRRLYAGFDAVLAPSAHLAAQLQGGGIARVQVQPLGVDTGCFTPSRADPAWRARLGYGPHDRLLLYVGRLAPEKHLDVLAAAVERLGPPYWLLTLGAGPVRVAGTRVRALPYQADAQALATAYASVDAFVHAGDQETFGLSALEALACGTPVLLRAAAGLAELADDSVGAAVPSAAPAAWAEAIAAVCARDRVALGAAARARALPYGWPAAFTRLLACYESLLAPAGRRRAPTLTHPLPTR